MSLTLKKWLFAAAVLLGFLCLPCTAFADEVRVKTSDELMKHLRQAVQVQYQIPAHQVLILWDDQSLEKKLTEMGGGLSVAVTEQDLRNLINRPSLLLKVMQGQQYKGRIPVQVKIDGWMEIYQSSCPLRQDDVLQPACLVAKRVQLSALPPQYIRSPFRMEDYQARQDIAAETLLRMNLLKPRPLVKRGNTVRVIVQNGALRLLAQGEALEAGARDDMIRVKILSFQSQKVVQARISNEDEVILDSGI